MQTFIPKLISSDQSGCVKSRYIPLSEHMHVLVDMLEFTADKVDPDLIAFLEFDNSFDSVSWGFLMNTLKTLMLGLIF